MSVSGDLERLSENKKAAPLECSMRIVMILKKQKNSGPSKGKSVMEVKVSLVCNYAEKKILSGSK